MFSLICVWINSWVNNHEAGDLKRYRAHYDVILMQYLCLPCIQWFISLGFYCCSQQSLQWRHNGRDGVSNHQPRYCLLNHLFRRRSKKTSKHRVTDLCEGNTPVTGEFPAQRASNAEDVSIWWRHRELHISLFLRHGALSLSREKIVNNKEVKLLPTPRSLLNSFVSERNVHPIFTLSFCLINIILADRLVTICHRDISKYNGDVYLSAILGLFQCNNINMHTDVNTHFSVHNGILNIYYILIRIHAKMIFIFEI